MKLILKAKENPEEKIIRDYHQSIDDLITSVERGEISKSKFKNEMEKLITFSLSALFLIGSEYESLSDLSFTARKELREEIQLAIDSINSLYDDAKSKRFSNEDDEEDSESELEPELNKESRLGKWVGFAMGVFTLGMLWLKGNPYLEWVYGPTEHCKDCVRLNGQVHRASEWRKKRLRPKSRKLECKGFFCQCRFRKAEGPSTGNF